MTRTTQTNRSRGRMNREPLTPRMTSAPHQLTSTDKGGLFNIYVVYRPAANAKARQDGRRSWLDREHSDLPPELFPAPPAGGSPRWLLFPLVSIALFVLAYAVVNMGAYVFEHGWVARNGMLHGIFCTSVDIAVSAGIGFQPQFERARCQEAWGSTPASLVPPSESKS